MRIKRKDIKQYTDLIECVVNVNFSNESICYLKDYSYNREDYFKILSEFVKEFILFQKDELLGLKSTLYIVTFYQTESEKLKIILRGRNPINKTPYKELKNTEVLPGLLITSIPLNGIGEITKAFLYLFEGYRSNSFIATNLDSTNNSFIDVVIDYDLKKYKLKYNFLKLKESFNRLYFTYGGFDYGRFIICLP
jgi:hypothetical protein